MKVGPQELGDEVTISVIRSDHKKQEIVPYISSRGEIKISLSEMTWIIISRADTIGYKNGETHVLMLEMLQEFQFSVGSL